jgi:opacity protein-like surface antigen
MKRFLYIALYCLFVCSIVSAQEKPDTTKPAAVSDTTKPAAAPDTTKPAAAPAVAPLATPATVSAPEMTEMEGEPGSWNIVALGGYTIPYEPEELKDQFKPSYNGGVGIAYLLPPGEHGYGEMLHYYNLSFNEEDFRTTYGVPANAVVYGYEGDIYTGMAQFRGVFGKANQGFAPFFTAAFGLYHIALPALGIEGQAEPVIEEYEKTTVGWSVGLGCDVAVTGNLTLFADGKFLLGVTGSNGHKIITAGAGVRYKL